MQGLLNKEDTIKMIEEQLSIKENEEIQLTTDIEKLQQNFKINEVLNTTNDRLDNRYMAVINLILYCSVHLSYYHVLWIICFHWPVHRMNGFGLCTVILYLF